ncbi:MAG: glycosyltransferase [Phormidium sp.]
MPLISVVIPVYNGEKTIKETIISVLSQTFRDFELIVINDGSQDRSLEIVSSVKDERLKVFTYPNAGLSASRNRGISLASGKYISFIDADDMWTPDKLELQLKALQENSEAAVAYSWTKYVDESGQFLRRGSHISVSGDVFADLLLNDILENGSNALIRKEVFDKVGGFDETLLGSEDWDMWLRIALHYHFVAVPLPQILYRLSQSSMSANILKMEAETQRVRDRAIAMSPESIKHLNRIGDANWYKCLLNRTLEGTGREQGILAARLLWRNLIYDPRLLRTRVFWKIIFKIAVMILLPPQQAQAILTKFNKLSNTVTILGYLENKPASKYIKNS